MNIGLVKSQMYQTSKYSDRSVTSIHLAIYDKSLLLDREKQCLLAIHQIQKGINCIMMNRRSLCEAKM